MIGRRPLADPGADRATVRFWIGLVVVVLSLVSALATYLILTGLTPIAPRNDVVFVVLLINIVLIVAMIAVIAWQVVGLVAGVARKVPGAACTSASSALFSVIAALPAILLAVGATTTFSRSLDSWFSKRTRADHLELARRRQRLPRRARPGDPHRHRQHGKDLDAGRRLHRRATRRKLQRLVMVQAGLRELPAAYVIDREGSPVVEATENAKLPYEAPSAAGHGAGRCRPGAAADADDRATASPR